jgi:hypothetical protein
MLRQLFARNLFPFLLVFGRRAAQQKWNHWPEMSTSWESLFILLLGAIPGDLTHCVADHG